MKKTVWLAMLIGFQVATAHADLKVKWDCYLPGSPLDCQVLERAYFSGMGFLADVPEEAKADLILRLRVLPILVIQGTTGGLQYTFDFIGAGPLPKFSLIDRVPTTISADNQLVRVVADLQKGTVPFASLIGPASNQGGTAVVTVGDPENALPTPPKNQDQTGWYLAPSLMLNLMKSANFSLNLTGSASVNWSSPNWRFQTSGMVNYQKIVISTPGQPDVTGEVFDVGGTTIVSYTIAGGWSVAALGYAWRAPEVNENVATGGEVGVEWALVPFMKSNERNIEVRYVIGPEYVNFASPNQQNQNEVVFFRHALQVYFAWHFDRVDLSLSASVSSHVDDYRYVSVSVTGGASFQITDQLSISANATFGYQGAFVNEPLNQDPSNPIESFLGTNNFSPFSFTGILSVTYVFGNSLLESEDQRWRNVNF